MCFFSQEQTNKLLKESNLIFYLKEITWVEFKKGRIDGIKIEKNLK